MRTSDEGRKRLMAREGVRLKAYQDTEGVWTIGVGHAATSGRSPVPRAGMTITMQECEDILARDLSEHYEPLLNSALKVPVADHEFDALVSIVFNVEAFAHSTAIKLLNAGDRAGCAKHIMDWNKPSVIIGRRKTEQAQFLTPYTGSPSIAPVPQPPPPDIPKPEITLPPPGDVPRTDLAPTFWGRVADLFKKG